MQKTRNISQSGSLNLKTELREYGFNRPEIGGNDMGITLNRFTNKLEEFKTFPAGETFTIKISDQEATEAAREYLTENKAQVKQLIQKRVGIGLSVDNPEVRFQNDEITMSASAGMGLLKARASLTAEVRWNGALNVNVCSVNVPFISVSPEKLNSVVERPLKKVMEKVEKYAEIRSFKLMNGFAILEAVRK